MASNITGQLGKAIIPNPDAPSSNVNASSILGGIEDTLSSLFSSILPIGHLDADGVASTGINGSGSFQGFGDPTGKYPLYTKEADTNRLASGTNLDNTVIIKKEATRTTGVPIANGGTWDQAQVPYNATYPYNHVQQTESGHIFELDDTPQSERIHLYHRTGTFFEIDANGTRVNKIVGDNYEIMERNGNVYVKGALNVTVDGAYSIKVDNALSVEISGSALINIFNDANINVSGNTNLSVGGDFNLRAANINMESDGEINMKSIGTTDIHSDASTNIKAELNVNIESVIDTNIKSTEHTNLYSVKDTNIKTALKLNIFSTDDTNIKTDAKINTFSTSDTNIKTDSKINTFSTGNTNIKTTAVLNVFSTADTNFNTDAKFNTFASADINIKTDATLNILSNSDSNIKANGIANIQSAEALNIKSGSSANISAAGAINIKATAAANVDGSVVNLGMGAGAAGAANSAVIIPPSGNGVGGTTITTGGTKYTSAPTVQLNGGGGNGATAVAILGTGTEAGQIVDIRITAEGSNYTSNPTVQLNGGGGSGATATAQVLLKTPKNAATAIAAEEATPSNLEVPADERPPSATLKMLPLEIATRGSEVGFDEPDSGDATEYAAGRISSGKVSAEDIAQEKIALDSSTSLKANSVSGAPIGSNCEMFNNMSPGQFNPNMKLSEYFTIGDLTHGGIRLPKQNYTVKGVTYTPQQILCNLKGLCINVLDPIAKKYGRKSFIITSGFRRPPVGNEEGDLGLSKSTGKPIEEGGDHPTGCGVDLKFLGGNAKMFEIAKDLVTLLPSWNQIILEYDGKNTWIHIGFKYTGNKGEYFTMNHHKTYGGTYPKGGFILV